MTRSADRHYKPYRAQFENFDIRTSNYEIDWISAALAARQQSQSSLHSNYYRPSEKQGPNICLDCIELCFEGLAFCLDAVDGTDLCLDGIQFCLNFCEQVSEVQFQRSKTDFITWLCRSLFHKTDIEVLEIIDGFLTRRALLRFSS